MEAYDSHVTPPNMGNTGSNSVDPFDLVQEQQQEEVLAADDPFALAE